MTDSTETSQLALRKQSTRVLAPGEDGTLVLLLLDRSGSMHPFGDSPLASANEALQVLQSMPGAERTMAGIWTFATDITVDVPPQPLLGIKPLTGYQASGGTSLYEAVGNALHVGLEFQAYALEAFQSRINVALSVITDGDDTTSQHLHQRCLTFAENARKAKFNMQVIGIGVDGPRIAKILGFEPGYSHTVQHTQRGVTQAGQHSTVFFSRTMMGGFQDSAPPPSSDSRP